MIGAIVFLPLMGALIAGLFARAIGERMAQVIPSALVCLAALLSWVVFFQVKGGHTGTLTLFEWFSSGDVQIDWALRVDMLTAVMLVVVNTVSAVVHVYSIGYMHEDPAKPRFFSYLSLFTFMMLMLVTANNFVQMFFGWEGVGLASYLLIGFWYHKKTANAAAIKAFIVNRVGDFGFLLGMFGVFAVFGTLEFDQVFAAAPDMAGKAIHFLSWKFNLMDTLCLLLFIGAMGKSAQFLLHTWLPDAMEGPTPVSALIHAATMVTAGVFMVCRLSPMFEFAPAALTFVTFIGATTAFFAATVGLVQNDIKRIIAYSTCSQLGYMFFAAGVGAYQAAMFHLFTHAFFKALLFLGAGSVIHAMHHEQDIRNMGGLRKKIPVTFALLVVGTLALTGVPIFAGFYSKDMIIESAFAGHNAFAEYAFYIGVLVALMTSFYSWRLIFKVFYGPAQGDAHTHEHAHESPLVMLAPMGLLFAGSILAGILFYGPFVGEHWQDFWQGSIFNGAHNHVLHDAHHVPLWVKILPMVAMLTGLGLAVFLYLIRPGTSSRIAARHKGLYQLFLNKWWFDEAYNFLLVRPANWLGRLFWQRGDGRTIDAAINGLSMGVIPSVTRLLSRVQSGYVFDYAFVMIIGIVGLIALVAI